MNQQQFDLIVKIVRNGAPALAEELVQSLVNLVDEYQSIKKQLNEKSENSTDVESEG